MSNLLMKDFKIGVHPMFFVYPFLFGALMLIPAWIYNIVLMYFFWITIPSMFAQYRAQNDLMFSTMMPVAKKDIVKARVVVIVILELLHIVTAMIYGLITVRLYQHVTYFFFPPHMGFWGLCFVMLAIFNIIFFPMYYKTAYKYGGAAIAAIAATLAFTGIVQWVGIQSPFLSNIFYGSGILNTGLQLSILIAGIVIFFVFTLITYRMSVRRFLKVEII